ncbi:MAG: hypothetical protein J5I47_10840 [Vicingus serpentipes]|nr:hypothetical protein [Vicingus serpentipes]
MIIKRIPYFLAILLLGIIFSQCSSGVSNQQGAVVEEQDVNPAAPDFDTLNSDLKAIEIADMVMEKMGGRKAWDDTKIIKWNFFGYRKLAWNKHSGDVRIQFGDTDSNVLITNVFTHTGKVRLDGEEMLEPDSVKKYTKLAESIWINDAYWLFMPFKLKDSKTTLKYLKVDTTENGAYSHVLQLTFNEIGDTPDNKYWVYVDTTEMLVNQWAYFANYEDSIPRFINPWDDYQQYGNILLSGGRGKRQISEIEVLDSISETFFTQF